MDTLTSRIYTAHWERGAGLTVHIGDTVQQALIDDGKIHAPQGVLRGDYKKCLFWHKDPSGGYCYCVPRPHTQIECVRSYEALRGFLGYLNQLGGLHRCAAWQHFAISLAERGGVQALAFTAIFYGWMQTLCNNGTATTVATQVFGEVYDLMVGVTRRSLPYSRVELCTDECGFRVRLSDGESILLPMSHPKFLESQGSFDDSRLVDSVGVPFEEDSIETIALIALLGRLEELHEGVVQRGVVDLQ